MTTMKMLRTPFLLLPVLLLTLVAGRRADAQAVPGPCQDGLLPSGALSRICVPTFGWNGQLVVFAHGYVAFNQPLGFYHLELPDGTSIPTLVQTLGFAFATTSYRQNGLAILEGVQDMRELVDSFNAAAPLDPLRTYVTGVSEGGIIAALLAERFPDMFTGALATCGPIGSFRGQVNYVGDFRVLFDYYFPGVIPGSPTSIPPEVIDTWNTVYQPHVLAAIAANPAAARELLRVAHVPFESTDPTTIAQSVVGVLWYNIFGTNDANAKLGGNPYGNRFRWYFGSSDDLRLNRGVRRFRAASAALTALAAYETSGDLRIPLVTLHTTQDEIIPVWHELLYLVKQRPTASGVFRPIPVDRYGHCAFTAAEVLAAFGVLLTLS
jgi:pimeloyl-ACP methyl ester carboxylesterase